MAKCVGCKTFKKADNCQKCFIKMRDDYLLFINNIIEYSNIHHLSTLDKIKNECYEKKHEVK